MGTNLDDIDDIYEQQVSLVRDFLESKLSRGTIVSKKPIIAVFK
ncbi:MULTISPECIES: hypothetical protein [unclassified Okeania]|nr:MULTISPECIES: hypothetical protein [unclassified Okeania]